ncbi:MAG: 6-bladed beta-propeller [Nitrospirota bacterium]
MEKRLLSRIKMYLLLIGISFQFFSFAGCATVAERETSDVKLFWPPPPQKSRIEYMRSIYSPYDIGITRTWLGRFLDSVFGGEEVEYGFIRPHGVFYSENETLFVTDNEGGIVHIMDFKNKRYSFLSKISDNEYLISPIAVAEDPDRNIYVSDSALNRILVFNVDGKYLFSFGEGLQRPTGLAIDSKNKLIYVSDTIGARIVAFDLSGGELYSFGRPGSGDGEFNSPTHIFLGQDGLLYVSDTLNFRVQVFDKHGRFQFKFGKPGDGSGDMSKPKGVAADSEGHIYVVDSVFETVQIFRRDGRLLLSFGSAGSGPGNFNIPTGIFIDGKDNIYVVDSYNRRIQIFRYIKHEEGR